jgi:hypothetical protein
MHMSAIPTTRGRDKHDPPVATAAKRHAPASATPFRKYLLAIIIQLFLSIYLI